ncbi:MAG: hypothetical protein IJ662_09285 [Clostridia bacterium]|nr:hypothetical protein [Clostridia bacterium]
MITINKRTLPSPSALSVKITPQAGTAQYNTLGELVQDGMKDKRTVEISWAHLSGDDLGILSLALTDGFFDCTYPDPLSGNRAMRCRCTARSARVYQYRDDLPVWADVKIILEEQ